MKKIYSSAGRRPAHRLARPLAALGLLLATAGAVQAQAPTFAAVAIYTTGGNAIAGLAVGDLNRDGKADVLASNFNSASVGVLLGTGTGTFGAATAFSSGGSNPVGVAAADVNGDNRLDIVVANQLSGTVAVLLGTGTGTFGAATTFSSGGTYPTDLVVTDVNGDSRLDIVTSNQSSGTVGVLLGTGTGSFGTAATFSTTTSGVLGLVVADVNSDTRPDLVVGTYTGSAVAVLLGTGTGTFGAATTFLVGAGIGPGRLGLADVNADGRPDLLTANFTTSTTSLLLSTGPGTFSAATSFNCGGSSPQDIAVADVNSDGRADVLTANSGNSTAGVQPGTGPGTFGTVATFSTGGGGSYPYAIKAADVNGDSQPDLLIANYLGSTLGVLLNTTTVVPAPTLTTLSPTNGTVGISVTLTGTNFTGATGVRFNGTAATAFTVNSATQITATVPSGASTGNVTVTTGSGTSNGVNFTVNPPANNALAFDGVNDYVNLGTSSTLQFGTGDFTAETWLRNDKPSSVTYTLALGSLGSGNFWLGAKNGYAALGLTGTDFVTPVLISDGRWHHVAAARRSGTLVIYVDGQAQLTQSSGQDVNTGTPFYLGNYATTASQSAFYWQGGLDETRLYNAGLTAAQVQADMFSTTAAQPANLKAYYNFDQGTAGGTNTGLTTLPDGSGTANTGTLTNFALTGTASNWVRSFPTITGIAPGSGAIGASVSVTGTNLLDATSFRFNGAAVAPFTTPTNDLTATITVPAGASTGPVSVASALLSRYDGPLFTFLAGNLVVSTTMSIVPGTYNNITVTGTGFGTLADDVVVNGALVVQDGGILSDGCHIFTGSGSFTLAAGGSLAICRPRGILAAGDPQGNVGTVRVTGGRSFSNDANYIYNGSDATGSGLPSQVRNLSVVVPGDVALTQPTSVTQALTLSSTGNLVLGSQALTLLSSATGTALVVNSGTGVVSGTATVQRYIDPSLNPGLGYRHYSAPVSNATVADLATAGFAPEVSTAVVYNNSATPGTTTPFPNVFGYVQARVTMASNYTPFDRGFVVPPGTNAQLAVGLGYAVNIGGNQLVDFNGTLNNGTLPIVLTRVAANADAGWQLLGNPYPAPIDFGLITAADRPNLDAAMYVFESSGQYTGAYRSYVNGVGASSLIGSSQGFFVRVSPGQTTGGITFRNSQRLTSYATQVPMRRGAADLRPLVQLELRGSTGPADVLFAYAEAGASPSFDAQFDAAKLPNSTGLNLAALATSGEALAIDGRPAFTAATVLPLTVGVPAAGTYTLTAAALSNLPAGLDAYLDDAATGQTISLSRQPAYSFSVTPAQAAAALTGRFSLHFGARTALATAPALTAAQVLLYPNPAHESFTVLVPAGPTAPAVQAELFNALGQLVRRQSAATGTRFTVPTQDLAPGVYTLRLTAGATTLTKRVVVE